MYLITPWQMYSKCVQLKLILIGQIVRVENGQWPTVILYSDLAIFQFRRTLNPPLRGSPPPPTCQ